MIVSNKNQFTISPNTDFPLPHFKMYLLSQSIYQYSLQTMYYNTAGYLTAPVVAEYIACGKGLTHPWRYYDRNQLQLANNLAIVLLAVIINRLNIWCILAQRTVDSPNTLPIFFTGASFHMNFDRFATFLHTSQETPTFHYYFPNYPHPYIHAPWISWKLPKMFNSEIIRKPCCACAVLKTPHPLKLRSTALY